MDYQELLDIASQKQQNVSKPKNYYPTKFSAPKKETKQSRVLSENIKKFLEKKEKEEQRKKLEEQKKKENLLALRDQKTKNKISKHLKVVKAANKSVIDDAIDYDNTAITLAGPSQPDEDDYGYVSQEASAFYDKIMNKYKNLPPEKPLFKQESKKPVVDLLSTKDRVKQALRQQEMEEASGVRKKRKSKDPTKSEAKRIKEEEDDKEENSDYEDITTNEDQKPKLKKKLMPPPLNYSQLLQIAQKKQFEPIIIEPKVKPKEEPERLMTKKMMREYAKEKEMRERRDQRLRESENPKPSGSNNQKNENLNSKSAQIKPMAANTKPNDKLTHKPLAKPIDKLNKLSHDNRPAPRVSDKSTNEVRNSEKILKKFDNSGSKPLNKIKDDKNIERSKDVIRKNLASDRDILLQKKQVEAERRKLEEEKMKFEEEKRKLAEQMKLLYKSGSPSSSQKPNCYKSTENKITSKSNSSHQGSNIVTKSKSFSESSTRPSNVKSHPSTAKEVKRKLPPDQVKSRPFPPADVKPRKFPPSDIKSRPFPPPDVKRVKTKSNGVKRSNGRQVLDSDEEEEYDSELDDFIDDGPLDEEEDYSKHISEIFGYDKNKYRYADEDGDDAAMESNYTQQLKEEYFSTKAGLEEDLEDIRKENLEKQRKATLKKKMQQRK